MMMILKPWDVGMWDYGLVGGYNHMTDESINNGWSNLDHWIDKWRKGR